MRTSVFIRMIKTTFPCCDKIIQLCFANKSYHKPQVIAILFHQKSASFRKRLFFDCLLSYIYRLFIIKSARLGDGLIEQLGVGADMMHELEAAGKVEAVADALVQRRADVDEGTDLL